jgi:hypothetical protein
MALSTEFKNIVDVLARDMSEGRASRQSLGGGTVAFGWTGGMPVTLANFVSTAVSDGLTVPATTVSLSPTTPPAVVAAGQAKPKATVITAGTIQLKKFAGYGEVTLEQVVDGVGMTAAVASVLGAGSLLAFESDAMAVLDAATTGTASGATWLAGILAGQAQVVGAGGSPGVLVVSAADYAAVIGELGGSAGFVTDPSSPVGSFFGAAVHVSPKLAAGKAYVVDPLAVVCVQHAESPVVITDPYSGSTTNVTKVVADLFACTYVTNPVLVVEVTKGALRSGTESESKTAAKGK